MIIETKFNLGQMVHKVSFTPKTLYITCETCEGKGYVTLNSETFCCPKHCDNGSRTKTAPPQWEVFGPYKIGNIQVTEFEKETDHHKNETRYMMYQTGVGSGTLHAEEDLFASLHDAEEEAEVRNVSGE